MVLNVVNMASCCVRMMCIRTMTYSGPRSGGCASMMGPCWHARTPILGSRDSARTRVLSPPPFFFLAAHVMCVKRKHLLIMDHCYATGTRKDEEEVLEEQTC